jgi:hypothetical protein
MSCTGKLTDTFRETNFYETHFMKLKHCYFNDQFIVKDLKHQHVEIHTSKNVIMVVRSSYPGSSKSQYKIQVKIESTTHYNGHCNNMVGTFIDT